MIVRILFIFIFCLLNFALHYHEFAMGNSLSLMILNLSIMVTLMASMFPDE